LVTSGFIKDFKDLLFAVRSARPRYALIQV